MKYTYVLAFSALALAQGPSPSCQSVVTETAYEYFYYCPCSSTTATASASTSFSTSTTTSGAGQVGPGLGSGTTTSSLSSTINIAPNPPIISNTATTSGVVSIAPPPLSSGGTFVVPTPPAPSSTTAGGGGTPPPPPSSGGQVQQIALSGTGDYQTRALLAHNTNRRNSSISDLVWNPTMAQYAMELAMTCRYGHSTAQGDGNYGQNIGAGFTSDEIPVMITNSMYNMEINFYPAYGVDNVDLSNFSRWGHFSQILWRDTTSVGCATYDCSNAPGGLQNTGAGVRPLFTVCNYFPPGNVDGQWSRVAQPQGGPTVQFV